MRICGRNGINVILFRKRRMYGVLVVEVGFTIGFRRFYKEVKIFFRSVFVNINIGSICVYFK